MPVNTENYQAITAELGHAATLIAVSKMRPPLEIQQLYNLGQRDFGENYVQELVSKQPLLPDDIRWHFIGHLQSNKVKQIAPFIYMIHTVDSIKLLEEIDKQAARSQRVIKCLLQVHIAQEETKFGLSAAGVSSMIALLREAVNDGRFKNVQLCGLMGMASLSEDTEQVKQEFSFLKNLFDDARQQPGISSFNTLSMGMSNDYKAALRAGSNMVRLGSILFGNRN